jgi:S1-C subfamily serine protease
MRSKCANAVFYLTAVLFAVVGLQTYAGATAAPPRASVVLVEVDDGTGSAVMVGRGVAITNCHVIENMKAIWLWIGQNRYPALPLKKQCEDDLALLGTTAPAPAVPIATSLPSLDEEVIAIGYPYGDVLRLQVVTYGRYQGATRRGLVAYTAQVSPGNSGGGLFVYQDGAWRLVGITSQVFAHHGTPVPYLAFAVPLASIQRLLSAV